jgi:predicted nuclease of predicted toxin-antitoxin system
MRFLIDAQLPPALAQALQGAGHQADHVLSLSLPDLSDRALWAWAKKSGAAIISKDEDFLNLSVLQDSGPFVVWIRYGNCSNQHLKDQFLPQLPAVLKAIQAGDKLIELI